MAEGSPVIRLERPRYHLERPRYRLERPRYPRLERPRYRPRWEGPFEAWAKKFAAANHWRVSALFEYEDAVQECGAIFARCCKLYDGKVNNDRWFMALYTTSVKNSFNTLARKNQKAMQARAAAAELCGHGMQTDLSAGPLLTAIKEASSELKEILRLIAIAPNELLAIMLDGARSHEAWSRSLCRFARTDKVRSDVILELQRILD